MRGAERSAECLQGAPDHAGPGAPFPGESVVSDWTGLLRGVSPVCVPKHRNKNASDFQVYLCTKLTRLFIKVFGDLDFCRDP